MQVRHLYRSRTSAFTLVELLVVIAILAMLAAILFPVFSAARANARRTACISNMRQIGMALGMYRQDYDELPPQLSTLTSGYIGSSQILICPGDPKQGKFAGNLRMEGDLFFHGGVSYGYVPRWGVALRLGWWNPGPPFGAGKWDDMTPVVDCPWHWAKRFDPDWQENVPGSKGWQLVLMMSGSVRKIRVEDPIADFTPARYN